MMMKIGCVSRSKQVRASRKLRYNFSLWLPGAMNLFVSSNYVNAVGA